MYDYHGNLRMNQDSIVCDVFETHLGFTYNIEQNCYKKTICGIEYLITWGTFGCGSHPYLKNESVRNVNISVTIPNVINDNYEFQYQLLFDKGIDRVLCLMANMASVLYKNALEYTYKRPIRDL